MAIGTLPPVIPEVPLNAGQPGPRPPRPERTAAPGGDATATTAATMPLRTVLGSAVAAALGSQDGFGPLYAALSALAGRPDLPPAVADAVEAVLSFRLGAGPTGASLTAGDLRRAVALSGLFHERAAAEAVRAGGAPPFDLKVSIVLLRAALLRWTAEAPAGGGLREAVAALAAAPQVRSRPPPPRRGGQAEPQRASAPPGGDPSAVPSLALAALAADEAARALDRIVLHQAASLDRDDAAPAVDADVPPGLVLELPIAGPNGTAVLDLRIEREPQGRAPGAPDGPVWRVDLACSVEPLGPLAARIGILPGRRVVIGLWCEEPVAVERLEAERGLLADALTAAGLDVAGIDLHVGRPPPRRSTPGHVPPHRLDVEL
jgi:hypothetical protein